MTLEAVEFTKFPKIPRLNRTAIITEKIDGTNGQVFINDDGSSVLAGSRNRWCNPGEKAGDNHGFGQWVQDERDYLVELLGPGTHYGEWYGQGIARNYGLEEKRFALFNSHRWKGLEDHAEAQEHGVYVVPTLHIAGPDLWLLCSGVDFCLEQLQREGSKAVPGFMRPEGIVVYMTSSGTYYKVTIEGDEKPKGSHEAVFGGTLEP